MSMLPRNTQSNKFGEYLYNNLPSIYKVRDKETDYTLKRYIYALGEQLSVLENDIKQVLSLLDVEKMDSKYLPFYASMFGVTYQYDVPEEFQRKYLANLVEIQKRKGTKEAIEFTARELTGMRAEVLESHIYRFRTWGTNPHDEQLGHYIEPKTFKTLGDTTFRFSGGELTDRFTIVVYLHNDKETNDVDLNQHIIVSRYVKELVQPYIKLIFKISGIKDSDTMENTTSRITEGNDEVYTIKEAEICTAKIQEGICYDILKIDEGSVSKTVNTLSKHFDKNSINEEEETHKVVVIHNLVATNTSMVESEVITNNITFSHKEGVTDIMSQVVNTKVTTTENSSLDGGKFEDVKTVNVVELDKITVEDSHNYSHKNTVTESEDTIKVSQSLSNTITSEIEDISSNVINLIDEENNYEVVNTNIEVEVLEDSITDNSGDSEGEEEITRTRTTKNKINSKKGE